MRSHVLEAREREQRHRNYLAAPLVSSLFPSVAELAVHFRFNDPEGKEKPQPYAQLFAPDMRAFFEFQCPLRECSGGGFDLSHTVPRFARKSAGSGGSLVCEGKRKRPHGDTSRCGLQLEYEVTAADTRAG